ncbi:MAG: SCO family protein [Chitinophagaceae bacterium]|nr:SCO family protein [Chitinophagaceae bacterium]
MSRKAILALCLVVLLPLIGYLLVSKATRNVVIMPPRYFPDTVINKVVNGKSVSDTVWHSLKNISLINQLGDSVSLDDLKGDIIVANFFFTRCPSICPTLTKNMKGLQDALKMRDPRRQMDVNFVHFLSFSVDPERDSVATLKKYADKYGVNPDVWWLLTGPKKTIYDFAFEELKLGIQDGEGIDANFLHTDKFVLIDREKHVRGYYSGLDANELSKLAEDLTIIMLEKDKKKKRKIF